MAKESARRIMGYGGLEEVAIHIVATKSDCHREKLTKFLTYHEPVWVIDADLWFTRECVLPKCEGSVMIGAPNNNPSTLVNVDKSMALCSCLISMDMWNSACRNVVEAAIENQRKAFPDGEFKADEKFLVEAALTHPQMTVARLSTNFNWCGDNPPLDVVAIHAAGRKDKLAWLRSAYAII